MIRICNEGKLNEDVFNLLLGNTRVREEREGDLTAQISSNRVGARRMEEAYENGFFHVWRKCRHTPRGG